MAVFILCELYVLIFVVVVSSFILQRCCLPSMPAWFCFVCKQHEMLNITCSLACYSLNPLISLFFLLYVPLLYDLKLFKCLCKFCLFFAFSVFTLVFVVQVAFFSLFSLEKGTFISCTFQMQFLQLRFCFVFSPTCRSYMFSFSLYLFFFVCLRKLQRNVFDFFSMKYIAKFIKMMTMMMMLSNATLCCFSLCIPLMNHIFVVFIYNIIFWFFIF